jgi:DNA-binding NtrC family response regulator
MKKILMVCEDKEHVQAVRSCFLEGNTFDQTGDVNTALEMLRKERRDFIFLDIGKLKDAIKNGQYRRLFQAFWNVYPTIEIIVMTPQKKIRDAVMAVKAGAGNYLTYPINKEEIKFIIEDAYESQLIQTELDYLRDQFWKQDSQDLIWTNSPAMQQVFEKVRSVAPTISTVLLVGETGTGKGVLAKIIHNHSKRSEAGFISLHCGAIPDTLLESELFGHEKGAFTGASRRKLGKFEISGDGTIFLDEIATLTPSAQIKLLQILQDKIFQRVGGEEILNAKGRIIAATNMDLQEMCAAGQFRKDLYYRLNVFPIEVPPLRERKEDIPLLVDIFLNRLNQFNNKDIRGIDQEVLSAFAEYYWPGNIRELENLVERAYILEKSNILSQDSFPLELFQSQEKAVSPFSPDISLSLSEARRLGIERIERSYLENLLRKNKGKINQTAALAKISSRQLHKLMKKYQLHKEDFKQPFRTA